MLRLRNPAIGGLLALVAASAAPAQPAPEDEATLEADAGPPIQPLDGALDERCAPTGLFRTTIRNISPGVPAAARGAQPRQIWRMGSLYLRSEEQPDPLRGDQAVVIIAEPDIWMVNLATREGRHTVDPGPVLEVRAPILPMSTDLPPTFRTLEFGCEAVFVARHAPTPERTVAWGAAKATLHTVTVGTQSVALLMDLRRERPLMISYQRDGKPVFVLRYDDYRLNLPERPDLFAPPKNVKLTPGGAGPRPLPLPVDP
jgi:hypothetical protein